MAYTAPVDTSSVQDISRDLTSYWQNRRCYGWMISAKPSVLFHRQGKTLPTAYLFDFYSSFKYSSEWSFPFSPGRLGSLQNTFHWQNFFLVFSLSFPLLMATYDVPWSPCFSTQAREAVRIKDWYINVFKRLKGAYTEGLRQNSIYSPPRECQNSGVSDFSGMGCNYCSVIQHF